MKLHNYIIVAILFFSTGVLNAQTQQEGKTTQEEEKLSLNHGSIDKQFEFVIKRSNNYQDYKVIKKNWLYTLKANALDSLKAVHKELENTHAKVEQQTEEITQLKSSLENTKDNLTKTNTEKDSMSLFGIQMSKSGYNFLLWSIIAGLLGLLILFIFKFKNSNTITKESRIALTETEEQFEEHRRIALEREQKVRRQLQDEINKQKSKN